MAKLVRYTAAVARAICDQMASGKSLSEICALPGMPSRSAVWSWRASNPEFGAQLDQARKWWADAVAEQIDELANGLPRAAEEAAKAGLNPNAAVMAIRTMLEQKRWYLGKLNQRYADKQQLEHTGAGGTPLLPEPAPDVGKIALAMMTIFHNLPGGANHPETAAAKALEARAREPILQAEPPPAESPRLIYEAPEPEMDRDTERRLLPWRYPFGNRYHD